MGAYGRRGASFSRQALREPRDQRANHSRKCWCASSRMWCTCVRQRWLSWRARTTLPETTAPPPSEMVEDNYTSMANIATQNGIKVIFASITPAAAYPWKPGINPVPRIQGAQQMAAGFLLTQWMCLSGLLQLHGGCEWRHASGPILGWRSSDSERVRGDGAAGGTCYCAGFGALGAGCWHG